MGTHNQKYSSHDAYTTVSPIINKGTNTIVFNKLLRGRGK